MVALEGADTCACGAHNVLTSRRMASSAFVILESAFSHSQYTSLTNESQTGRDPTRSGPKDHGRYHLAPSLRGAVADLLQNDR